MKLLCISAVSISIALCGCSKEQRPVVIQSPADQVVVAPVPAPTPEIRYIYQTAPVPQRPQQQTPIVPTNTQYSDAIQDIDAYLTWLSSFVYRRHQTIIAGEAMIRENLRSATVVRSDEFGYHGDRDRRFIDANRQFIAADAALLSEFTERAAPPACSQFAKLYQSYLESEVSAMQAQSDRFQTMMAKVNSGQTLDWDPSAEKQSLQQDDQNRASELKTVDNELQAIWLSSPDIRTPGFHITD